MRKSLEESTVNRYVEELYIQHDISYVHPTSVNDRIQYFRIINGEVIRRKRGKGIRRIFIDAMLYFTSVKKLAYTIV